MFLFVVQCNKGCASTLKDGMKNVSFSPLLLLLLLMAVVPDAEGQRVRFGKYFSGRTLRLDCLREGSSRGDTVWALRWVDRRSDWHGSRKQLIDPFPNGDYRVEMRDERSGKAIYSRAYGSLFREYCDTPAGRKGVKERFEETLLLPMPKRAVVVALQKRGADGRMKDATLLHFDPESTPIEHDFFVGERVDLEVHGDPSQKVDVVIVAQGYGGGADPRLRVDYYRIKEILFGKEPFASHRSDFNVYGVVGDVGAEYNTFGIDRYLMTPFVHRLHSRIGTTPCDFIIVMVNDTVYGGGAIYNLYAVTSMHPMAEYVLPHEFGHHFGGLADEYVDTALSYGSLHQGDMEPFEPNITNLKDFASKWKSMLPSGTPVPTPANSAVPRSENGPLGVYEGAGYAAKGIYRPTMHCMMRDYAPFCPVCKKRLEEVFGLYTK